MAETSSRPTYRNRDAMAADLCVRVLLNGKDGGRFMMALDELMRAAALPRDLFETAKARAVEHDWLRPTRQYVELKAAGIYVAKQVLGLPR